MPNRPPSGTRQAAGASAGASANASADASASTCYVIRRQR
jgi:hypothetical protein